MAYDKLGTYKTNDEINITLTFKAHQAKKSKSEFIRDLIINEEVIADCDNNHCAKAVSLLGHLTGNINQIADNLNIANQDGSLNDINFDNLLDVLFAIRNEARNLL